jgi:chromosome segregation ATPase
MKFPRGASFVLLFVGCLACNNAAQKPIVASAADQTTYAVRYPDTLASSRGRFAEHENRASRLSGEISTFTADIDTKNWNHVARAYKLSDASGKSASYAERYEQTEGINTFFTEEKDKLNQAVAGNVHYSAKQNNCKEPNEVAGAATFALGKSVEKQLKERMRSSNEAQAYVDAHAEAIGSKSVEKLRDQVDTLTELSYVVHVGVEKNRRELQSLLEESAQVRKTLDDAAKEADEQAQDTTQPEPDRKAAKARAEAARASAGRIESEQQQAKFVLDETEKRIEKIRSDYQQAFDALINSTEQKAAATPAVASK